MPSVAQIIGRRMHQAGVRYVMGHPGGEVVDLIEGFRVEGLTFVLTKHETSAAFMADAIGTMTGVPGVCLSTLGPGATNLVTGVSQAYLDRSPVIALTGQLPPDRYEVVTHQRLDLGALFAPITKMHGRVTALNADDMISRALRVTTRPRRGPAHLEIPSDVAPQEARERAADTPELRSVTGFRQSDAEPLLELLAASRRPVILAGTDANRLEAATLLRAFAESWSLPVIVGPKAKGSFPEDHPLFLGTIEMLGTAHLFDYVDKCDLVLMVGFDPVEFDRDWSATANSAHIGLLPNDDLYFRTQAELVGPIEASLSLLLTTEPPAPKHALEKIRETRMTFLEHINPRVSGMAAQQVLGELRRALPRNALVTCDVGFNKAVTGQCWPVYEPLTFFMSNGLSTMGYGLPAALGLQLAAPDRRVACVIGDGGFAMVMAEIETAVRQRLPVIIVVLVDDTLSQIKASQDRKGLPPTGTSFGRLDYLSLANAFGVAGYVVSNPGECADAFHQAVRSEQTTLIAAIIDSDCYRL